MRNTQKLTLKHWLSFVLVGLVGQFAWTIENMYLNQYVFYLTGNADYIAPMTAASAIAATVTTLLIGALSDRLGKRKIFISFGYIIWGVSIISFAFLDPKFFGISQTASMLGVMVIILDCIMTFFGTTANDACFNAFVTDTTSESNRGKVESVLSILPLISMLVIVGLLGGMTTGENPNWLLFFCIIGGLTTAIGIGSLFFLPKDTSKPNKTEPYFKNIFYGFRPSIIKKNFKLYLALAGIALFNMAIQVFFPYFIVYVQQVLKVEGDMFTIVLGSVLLVSSIATVVFGLFMDKIGKNKILIPTIIVGLIGQILMFFVSQGQIAFAIIAGIVAFVGYLVPTAVLNAKIRDYTPQDEVGLFQGVRMIFAVMFPMVTGPYIGEFMYKTFGPKLEYVNEFGQKTVLPNNFIFIGVAIALAISIIPLIFIIKKEGLNKKDVKNDEEDTSK